LNLILKCLNYYSAFVLIYVIEPFSINLVMFILHCINQRNAGTQEEGSTQKEDCAQEEASNKEEGSSQEKDNKEEDSYQEINCLWRARRVGFLT